jgi:predicted component of type VI protein secretion system
MYMLRLFEESDMGHPIDARILRDGALRIGRDPVADWSITDPDREISRWHCELDAHGEQLSVRCQGANGVFDDETGERLPQDTPVPLDPPVMLRFGRFRLMATFAPQDDRSDVAFRTMVLTPPLGRSTTVPSDWSDAPSGDARPLSEGSLLEAFCEGAGLDASLLSGEEPIEVMRRAGAVYRQMVLGIGDLMSERDHARARYQLSRTTISGMGDNPFKWAPTQRLAIDLLLAGSNGFLSGPAALKASFQDIKRHLVATFAGLHASLRAAVDSFDPSALAEAASSRPALLKNRASHRWREVIDRHQDLVRQLENGEGGSLDDAFVQAYDSAEREGL